MEKTPKARSPLDTAWSIAILVCLWIVLAIWAYAGKRTYYEDEIMSLHVVQKSFGDILRHTYHHDYHPFGYYFYLKALFSMFGSSETVAFVGSMVLTATALGLLLFTFLNMGGKHRDLAIMLLALNPMLLLHGSAARWYPLWTVLAAGAVYALTRREALSWATILVASFLIASAAYVNYITVVLGAAIVLWLLSRREYRKGIVLVLIVVVLFVPWLPAFYTHATHSSTQFMRGSFMRVKSLTYVGFSLLLGQTISPWQITPWAVGLIGLGPLIVLSAVPVVRDKRQRLLVILLAVALVFCFTCRYQRARSLLFFSAVLSVLVVLALDHVRPRLLGVACLVILLGCNFMALANMRRGVHYHKKGLSDPIPAVVAQMRELCQWAPTVVLTTNLPLTYYLSRSNVCEVESPFNGYEPVPRHRVEREEEGHRFRLPPRIVLVHSYLGSLYSYKDEYEAFREQARQLLGEPATVLHIKKDLDRDAKMRGFKGTVWPEYRFTIEVYRNIKPEIVSQVTKGFREIWQEKRKPYIPSAE